MKRTKILCPECTQKNLLQNIKNPKELLCDECGAEFVQVGDLQEIFIKKE